MPHHCDACGRRLREGSRDLGVLCGPCQERQDRSDDEDINPDMNPGMAGSMWDYDDES